MSHTVIVVLESKPGSETQLRDSLLKVASLSRAEKTCLAYKVHQSLANACEFVLYETWESPEAHQQQFSKPYILEFGQTAEPLLAKPYQVILVQEL